MEELGIHLDADIDEKVQHAPVLLTSSHDAAEKIASIARDTARVKSGDYKAGIVVQDTKSGARVFASDYKSAWEEFGVPSQGQPATFNLRHAAEAAGFKFKKHS
jgi:hypothetical protein